MKEVFRFVLILLTVGLLVYCTIIYIQNDSTTSTEYRRYHKTKKDLYPSINLCFYGSTIFDSERMKNSYGIDNVLDYIHYLSGEEWNESMVNVDYDEVTDHLKEYFNGLDISFDVTENNLAYQWVNRESKSSSVFSTEKDFNLTQESFPFYISQRTAKSKCFTFDFSTKVQPKVEGKIIRRLIVYFNISKSLNISLHTFMNYPGQLTRTIPLDVEADKSQNILSDTLDVKMISIGVNEVLRRRKSSKESCNPNSERSDEFLFRKVASTLNCRPSHWKNVNHPTICNNSDAMRIFNLAEKIFHDPDALDQIDLPCDELIDVHSEKIYYPRGTFGVDKLKDNIELYDNTTRLMIFFDRSIYREITHYRDYNLEGLIGNGGGYVGLFLGFAAWQIPDFCYLLYSSFAAKIYHNSDYNSENLT